MRTLPCGCEVEVQDRPEYPDEGSYWVHYSCEEHMDDQERAGGGEDEDDA